MNKDDTILRVPEFWGTPVGLHINFLIVLCYWSVSSPFSTTKMRRETDIGRKTGRGSASKRDKIIIGWWFSPDFFCDLYICSHLQNLQVRHLAEWEGTGNSLYCTGQGKYTTFRYCLSNFLIASMRNFNQGNFLQNFDSKNLLTFFLLTSTEGWFHFCLCLPPVTLVCNNKSASVLQNLTPAQDKSSMCILNLMR